MGEISDFLRDLAISGSTVRWWRLKSTVIPPDTARYDYSGSQTTFMENENVKVSEQSLWTDQGTIVCMIRPEATENDENRAVAVASIEYNINLYDHLIDETGDIDEEYVVRAVKKSPSNLYKTLTLRKLL